MTDSTPIKTFRPLTELLPAEWSTGSVETGDGANLHYTRTGGDKPALIMLHGFMMNGLYWLRAAKALSPAYDLVLPDLRGHGETTGPVDQYSAGLHADDLRMLIDALGLEKPLVVGHSMGADAAAVFAARYADHLSRLVLVDPARDTPPRPDDSNPGYKMWYEGFLAKLNAMKTMDFEGQMETAMGLMMPGQGAFIEDDFVPMAMAYTQFNTDVLDVVYNEGPQAIRKEIAEAITCPVLLMTANPARMMGPQGNHEVVLPEAWRGWEHVHFEDAGHMIDRDAQAHFLNVLEAFLKA